MAEEAARATARASYAKISAGLNEQAKPDAARSEEKAKQLQNEYFNALSAYTTKYKDYGFANEIKTDHILKEVEDEYKGCMTAWIIFLICVLPLGFLLIALIEWIGGVIGDWISRLFHSILLKKFNPLATCPATCVVEKHAAGNLTRHAESTLS